MPGLQAGSQREPLDSIVRLVTPERIVIAHPLAGPSRRFAAYLIDQALIVSDRCRGARSFRWSRHRARQPGSGRHS